LEFVINSIKKTKKMAQKKEATNTNVIIMARLGLYGS
jgi:hypothetical protein